MEMNWNAIGKVVGSAAPIVGSLLGGPAGGAVGSIVASLLGVPNEPEAVSDALKNNPNALLKLKQYELNHVEELERMRFQTLEVELSDKANARKMHRKSVMPAVITCALTLLVAGLGYALFKQELLPGNKDVAFMLFGQVSALWGASVTYWVGTTRSSADKTDLMTRG